MHKFHYDWESNLNHLAERFIEATGDNLPPPEFDELKEYIRKLEAQRDALLTG